MFHFLGFLLIIFLMIVVVGAVVVTTVFRTLFGWGGKRKKKTATWQEPHFVDEPHASASRQRPRPSSGDEAVIIPEEGTLHINRKKVFDKNEGEYVDFEEV